MPKRKIKIGEEKGFIGEAKSKRKAPEKYALSDLIKNYWLQRDRLLYKTCDEETKKAILERYGVKNP